MLFKTDLSYFNTPRDTQIENAKLGLGEEDDKLNHNEKLLHDWIDTLSYFPKNYDENMARNFLRYSKHNLERTKQKLEMHYVLKNAYPHFYTKRDPFSNEIVTAMKLTNVVALPNYTENGERILVWRLGDANVKSFNMTTSVKLFFMIYDLALTAPYPISTDTIIIDGAGVGAAQVAIFVCQAFKQGVDILRKSYSVRLKRIHMVNVSPAIEKILNFVKSLLHEKIAKRFTIHKSTETLLEEFSEKLLPKDYGGFLKPLNEIAQDCLKMMQDNAEWYKKEEFAKITADIPKYRETLSEISEQAGLQGSFRQLSID